MAMIDVTRYAAGMGQRSGGTTGAQGAIAWLLRYLVPLILLLFGLNALGAALEGAPGVGDVAHLKAIGLPLEPLLRWMAGGVDPGLVPAPPPSMPLPLLLDWLLWRIQPFGMPGLRVVHLAMAIAALALLLRAVVMRMDARTALVAGLIIALSPRFIEAVTNLGAEPYVFILFSWQLAILLTRGKIGGLGMFAAVGTACGLCGVPGMIAATSLFAVLLYAAQDRADAWRRARLLLVALPVWAALIYVQLVASGVAGMGTDPTSTRWLLSLGTKLVVHNADLLLPPGAALLAGGTAVLILLGLYSHIGRRRRNGPSERKHPYALLLVGTVAGALLVLLAGPLLRLYGWTEPAAQAWLGLLITLLAAACFTPRLVPATDALRRLRLLATGAMIAGAVAGMIAYHYRTDWFAAGPEAGLARALGAAGPNRAILYTGADWGRVYFPHDWLAPADGEQWLLTLDGQNVQHILPGGQLADPQPLAVLGSYNAIVIARVDRRGWRDLNAVSNTEAIGALPPARLDAFPQSWTAEPAQAAPGEYWLTTQLLRKQSRL